jgi:NADPH:quinone reductase-like Zn-dependent oxidoreductase
VAESTSPIFKVGDEVFGNVQGSLADFALCEENKITHKPQQLSWTQAASIGTAYVCLT